MYSPTTRLLAVLALLESHEQITGVQIAQRLEVDARTVRRYITSLQDMGVPVEGERGPRGAYSLGRGTKMPPLMFTNEEAIALTLGLRMIREFQFPVNAVAIESALAKTERVLPEKVIHQIRGLHESVIFNISSYGIPLNTFHQENLIVHLVNAVYTRQSIQMIYETWENSVTERIFDPYGIVYNDGYWYTAGYCHLRQAMRCFRLDRIMELKSTSASFEIPDHFDVLAYVLESVVEIGGEYEIEVVFETSLESVRTLIPSYVGTVEPCKEGIVFHHRTSRLDWIAHLLLNFDCPIFIKQPDELYEVLTKIGSRIQDMRTNRK